MNSKRARPRTTSLRTHAFRRNPTSGVSWDSIFLRFGSEKALVEEMSYHIAMILNRNRHSTNTNGRNRGNTTSNHRTINNHNTANPKP